MGKRKLIIPATRVRVPKQSEWEIKQSAYEKDLNERIEKIKAILRSHGIQMSVYGCGCCDSPTVKFAYEGKLLIDDGCVNFSTEDDEEAGDA